MMPLASRLAKYFVFPLIVLTLFINFERVLNQTVFYVFQSRDLARALELLQGHSIFFGPEMTGGGNLPGPAYYALLAGAFAIHPSWWSAWWAMLVLCGAGALILFGTLQRRRLGLAAWVFLPLFASMGQTQRYLTLFINPSYLFVFVCAALALICAMTLAPDSRARHSRALAAAAVIGVGCQVHFSIVFLLFALLMIQACAPKFNEAPYSRHTRWLTPLAFAAPLSPYALWFVARVLGWNFGQQPPYVGDSRAVLPTLAYLVQEIANLNPGAIAQVITQQTLRATPLALVPLALTFALTSRVKRSPMATPARRLIPPLLICAGFGFIPFSYIFVVPIANRYGMPFYIVLLVLVGLLQTELGGDRARQRLYNVFCASLLAALTGALLLTGTLDVALGARELLSVALTSALVYVVQRNLTPSALIGYSLTLALAVMQGQLFRSGYLSVSPKLLLGYKQWQNVWARIQGETGWTLADARHRIYFINVHIDQDPEFAFQAAANLTPIAKSGGTTPDGYFVIHSPPPATRLREWLLSAPIAAEIKTALADGSLELGTASGTSVAVVPYRVRPDAALPRHVHNWALFYHPLPPIDLQLLAGERDQSARRLEDGRYLFRWNECPEHDAYCTTGALVSLSPVRRGRWRVNARIFGAPLAQVSPWIHPTWTEAWNAPFLDVRCADRVHRLRLANAVGYKRENLLFDPVTGYFVSNNSLVAPFERSFQIECATPQSLTMGRASSSVDHLRSTSERPARALALSIEPGDLTSSWD